MGKLFYSPSTNGFFDSYVSASLPSDCVEISESEHAAILQEQAAGKHIAAGANGRPLAIEPLKSVERFAAECDQALRDMIDDGAKSWGYDDIKSAVSYVGDPCSKYNAEAVVLRDWRSSVWTWRENQKPTDSTTVAVFVSKAPKQPTRPEIQ